MIVHEHAEATKLRMEIGIGTDEVIAGNRDLTTPPKQGHEATARHIAAYPRHQW